MKKTLLVTNQFPPAIGGVETHLYNIATRLDPELLIVLADESTGASEFDALQDYETIRAPFLSPSKLVWPRWLPLVKKIREIISLQDIEGVLAGQVLPVGTAAMMAAEKYKIPYYVYTYAYDVEVAKRHWRRQKTLKKVLKNAKHVFTISDDTRNRMTDIGIPESKIAKITPGLDMKAFLPSEEKLRAMTEELKNHYKLEGKKVLMTVGRLVARKGQDMVIKAMPAILKEYPDAHYVIAGGGEYEKELKKLVADNNLKNHVTFTGRFDEAEKSALYNMCDIFIMVSRIENAVDIEGFGIVYLEANALKKPVIGARVGGVPDAISHERTGLLVGDPTDSAEIATAVKRLLRDQVLAHKLGEQGKERVMKNFDWDSLVRRLEEYL